MKKGFCRMAVMMAMVMGHTLGSTPSILWAASAAELTQYGITWHFDKAYTYGQFCTGDYWVVADANGVTITSISMDSVSGVSTVGSTRNPRWGSHAYCARTVFYDMAQAVTLPLTLGAGETLASTMVYDVTTEQTDIYNGAVLTIVDAAQSADKFRPPYCRPDRVAASASDPLIYSSNDIQWNYLPRLAAPNLSHVPDFSAIADLMQRPWLDQIGTSAAGMIHPYLAIPAYGYALSQTVSKAAIQVCLAYTVAEQAGMERLVRNLIQIGIDQYGMVLADGKWEANGGHGSGRKFPIVFAACMLNNAAMKNFSRLYSQAGAPIAIERFGEDGQTYYFDDPSLPAYVGPPTAYLIADHQVDATYHAVRGVRGWLGALHGGPGDVALWRITHPNNGIQMIVHEHLPIDEWDPVYGDNLQSKFEAYRTGCTSASWIGQALALRLLGTEFVAVWDHNVYFDYCSRWMSEPNTDELTMFQARYGATPGMQQFTSDPLVDDMWAAYGTSLPLFYNPTPGATFTPEPTLSPTPTFQNKEMRSPTVRAIPNPGRNSMTFEIELSSAGGVEISIYNVSGERISRLLAAVSGLQAVGIWDCQQVAPGVYWAQIRQDGKEIAGIKVAVTR